MSGDTGSPQRGRLVTDVALEMQKLSHTRLADRLDVGITKERNRGHLSYFRLEMTSYYGEMLGGTEVGQESVLATFNARGLLTLLAETNTSSEP